MSDWGKIINEFVVEYAPTNYENISNFNLDEELMFKYGFRPIRVDEYTEEFKYPKLKYTLVKDEYILGHWENVPPTVEELCETMLTKLNSVRDEQISTYNLYVDDNIVKFNRYSIEEINAFIASQEEQYILTENKKYVLFNQTQLLKLLRDKLKTNSEININYQNTLDRINEATSIEELEDIVFIFPILYYNFQDLRNKHIGNEKLLDKSTEKFKNALNISIYHSDETRVYYGELGIKGKDYLDEHHIPAIKLSYNSGTIVGLEGDLNLTCTSMNPYIDNDIYESLLQAIKNLGFNASLSNNDILIDGKKCIGCSNFVSFNETQFYTMYIHISFNIDNELIDIVRVKPKVKDCTGLKIVNPNITQEDVINNFYKTLNEKGYRRFECQE